MQDVVCEYTLLEYVGIVIFAYDTNSENNVVIVVTNESTKAKFAKEGKVVVLVQLRAP
jgi:hypothetical protein